jgi:predicted RNA binding protein YcfA (HicA-like mRNA interferase family)
MPPLPMLPGAGVVKALEKDGFMLIRVKGSHHIMIKPRRSVHRRTRPSRQGYPTRDPS